MMEQKPLSHRELSGKNHQIITFVLVLSYLVVSLLGSVGIYKLINFELGLTIIASVSLLNFHLTVKAPLSTKQIAVLLLFSALFIHTLATSGYLAFSAVLAFYAITSAALFVSLQQSKHTLKGNSGAQTAIIGAKYAFIFFAIAHAITLIFFYLFQPVRTTGLLDDYSQASIILLIAIGFAYPLWKDKSFFSAFALIMFLAYFTSYSRTANFLLFLFLFILFFIEYKNKSVGNVFKLLILATLAAIVVTSYPEFVDREAIDRGGLAHFSTLNSRTIYWQTAWDAILQKPWLGWGLRTYAWTGIQETQPFNIIYFVHNDYLQIWHDLGVFWLILFVGIYAFILLKYLPIKFNLKEAISFTLVQQPLTKSITWLLLVLIAMYMCVNFLIASLEFQIAIAILLVDLLDND